MFNNNLLMGAAAAASGADLVSVGNSALYVVGNDEYLSRTPSSGGSRTTWTFSTWTDGDFYFSASNGTGSPLGVSVIMFNNRQVAIGDYHNSSGWQILKEYAPYWRDPTGWFNIVAVYDSSNAVEAERIRVYVNGVKYITTAGTVHQPTASENMAFNDTVVHNVGKWVGRSGFSNNSYQAETVFLDGTAVTDASSFGQFDSSGLYWTPKSSDEIKDLTFGTNGFYLDNTTNAQTDASGEGNNWTNNNTVTTTAHSPTNLYAVQNPLTIAATNSSSLANGNLKQTGNSGSYWAGGILATLPCDGGGKYYWEAKCIGLHGTSSYIGLGVAPMDLPRFPNTDGSGNFANPGNTGYQGGSILFNGASYTNLRSNNQSQDDNIHSSLTIATNDFMQIAFDSSNGKLWYGKNNSWYNSGAPASGTNPSSTLTATDKFWFPWFGTYTASDIWQINYGATDFEYTPPTNFNKVNTTQIASDTTRTASDSSKYFSTVLYEGNGAGQRVGDFQPFTDTFTVAYGALVPATGYLTRTFDEAGNRQIFSLSSWFKIGQTGEQESSSGVAMFASFNGSSNSESTWFTIRLNTSNQLVVSIWNDLITTRTFEDTSQWYHLLVAVDTTQSTASNRIKVYINGVQETSFGTANYPTEDATLAWGVDSTVHYVGKYSTYEWNGYLAQTAYITGTQLTPSSFGQTDTSTNRWIPKDISGLTFGSAGFFLDYADSGNVGDDESGNTNDFTNNNSVAQVTDSPTINVATLDPNANTTSGGSTALSNGNRTSTQSSNGTTYVGGILVPESGKFVWEVTVTNVVEHFYIGIKDIDASNTASSTLSDDAIMYQNDGTIEVDGTTYSSSPATYTDGDVIRVEWDVNVKIEWFKNDSSQGSYGLSKSLITYKPFFVYNDDTAGFTVNFGSSSFTHTPTTGYSTLTQDNIASSDQFISAFSWIKNRDATDNHMLFDRVRGVTKDIHSNTDDVQATNVETVQQFLAAGVQIGNDVQVNTSAESYVLWNFMAEATGSGSSNEDGSINTASTLVDTTLGLSISQYEGTGSNATVGHGLGVVPEMIMVKEITGGASNWQVYHASMGNTKVFYLNLANAAATDSAFQNTTPTSTVFSIGTGGDINGSGNTYIAYCFAPSQFISIGSYTNNNNADGTFVPTVNSLGVPLQPVWILTKTNASAEWMLNDAKRIGYNIDNNSLYPAGTTVESTADIMDIVTGGFKLRTSNDPNYSTSTTIYMVIGTPIIDTDGRVIAGR